MVIGRCASPTNTGFQVTQKHETSRSWATRPAIWSKPSSQRARMQEPMRDALRFGFARLFDWARSMCIPSIFVCFSDAMAIGMRKEQWHFLPPPEGRWEEVPRVLWEIRREYQSEYTKTIIIVYRIVYRIKRRAGLLAGCSRAGRYQQCA